MVAGIINRVLVFVLGAVLAASGVFLVIEAVWTWTGSGFVWIRGQAWLRTVESTAWSYSVLVAISVAVALGGLVLVVGELRPQRKRFAAFPTDDDDLTILLVRRSAEGHLRRRLQAATAISPMRVRVDPERLRWNVRVKAGAARSTRRALEEAASGELEALHAPQARLRVRTTGRSK